MQFFAARFCEQLLISFGPLYSNWIEFQMPPLMFVAFFVFLNLLFALFVYSLYLFHFLFFYTIYA